MWEVFRNFKPHSLPSPVRLSSPKSARGEARGKVIQRVALNRLFAAGDQPIEFGPQSSENFIVGIGAQVFAAALQIDVVRAAP